MTTDEAEYREKIRDDDMVAERCARERAEDAAAKLETRFCKDCRWCSGGEGFERCEAPQNTDAIIDLVSGKAKPKFSFCSSQRDAVLDSDKTCGREGRWFELKTD